MGSFVDPRVEGVFTSDTSSRAKVHEYIEEQIRAHESIIRYYKKRQNALTVTCRIPPEVLACIFGQVVEDAVGGNPSAYNFICWIKTVSHICSHWREVALSTPSLWSTILVEYYPTWTSEMLKRSKTAPLSVINLGSVSKTAYPILLHTLASHLPRIQDLVVGRIQQGLSFYSGYKRTSICLDEFRTLLQVLGQHNLTEMKRLEMNAAVAFPNANDANLQLPDQVITRSTSLQHLTLEGFGINWELSPTFTGLKSIEISSIPKNSQPSVVQLLCFLSQVPLLETLSVSDIDVNQNIIPSHDVKQIHMRHLEDINVSCGSLSIIDFFFDHLKFSTRSCITANSHEKPSTDTLQRLTQRLDDATIGPVLGLALRTAVIHWWKKPKDLEGKSVPATLVFKSPSSGRSAVNGVILRALRLDQLVYLDMKDYSDQLAGDVDIWALIGDLPRLEELEVCSNEKALITALYRRVHIKRRSKTRNQAIPYPAFPALTNLSIEGWEFDARWNASSRYYTTVAEKLLDCVKLRHRAKLPLKKLRIENCTGVEEFDFFHMEEVVDEVYWDGSGDANESAEEDLYDVGSGDHYYGFDDSYDEDYYGF
ncbi:hypothetical protein H0H92_014077 [Tricholoma furcatifolium]|nr:hypothetical protein H0H92_014077 [Tricholoma furcatifolium]